MRLFLVILLAVSFSARAQAGNRDARRLKRKALAHYRAGDYAAAARDFRASYELEAHPELLYAIGQSLRLSGDCAGAIDAYQDFLITSPAESQASAAREKIETCRQVLAPTPQPEPVAAPPPPAVVAAPPVPATRPGRVWYRDAAGGALLAGGVVSAAAGTWLVVDARGALDAVDRAGTEEEFIAARAAADRARGRHTAGLVLLGAGGGLMAAAVVRYLRVRRDRSDDHRPALSATITHGGAGLVVGGSF